MAGIPEVMELLDKIKKIHAAKNADYAQAGEPFQNFERSALLAEWFNDSKDKAFVVLIGTKLARLATLLNSGKTPNNESIADSFLDLTTYCALWAGEREMRSYDLPVNKVTDVERECPENQKSEVNTELRRSRR